MAFYGIVLNTISSYGRWVRHLDSFTVILTQLAKVDSSRTWLCLYVKQKNAEYADGLSKPDL